MQGVEEFVQQRGLASTDFASQHHEAFACLNSVFQSRQRFVGVARGIQISGIGIDVEWILFKSEVGFIHLVPFVLAWFLIPELLENSIQAEIKIRAGM